MDNLSDTPWDVVISGTGLQQSLLALALSRSGKKILHVDPHSYYGGSDAAFSLQEAEEWIEGIRTAETRTSPFSNGSIWKAETADDSATSGKLSSSRAYTLTLSPQIIYSKSKLLSQLVSSKVYRQIEFQAVGNWWMYESPTAGQDGQTRSTGMLKRLPNGREDIFSDRSIDVRAKRGLMKFLKFVVEFETKEDIWMPHAEECLPDFLSTHFQLPPTLQTFILSLTLSLQLPSATTVRYSLARIARHLTSIGVFGPGFGAVVPKWGGGSELAQVACRAGAVGGGVYVLGTGVSFCKDDDFGTHLTLTNDEVVHTKHYAYSWGGQNHNENNSPLHVSKLTAIVSSDLRLLFASTVEGAPTPAVTVVAIPSNSVTVDNQLQKYPVYIMVHSSDTGECPINQCVIYASTMAVDNPKPRLEAALSSLLSSYSSSANIPDSAVPTLLYEMYYELESSSTSRTHSGSPYEMDPPSVDLAFDDTMLQHVEDVWSSILSIDTEPETETTLSRNSFMYFEDREQMEADDDDDTGF